MPVVFAKLSANMATLCANGSASLCGELRGGRELRGQHVSFQKHLKDMDCAILRMVNAVYAIDDFSGDALLWRIEWIGGVGYNTSVLPLVDYGQRTS